MIAFDDEAVRSVLSVGIQRKTAHTITEPLALRSELGNVRESGIAFDRGDAYEHLVCVAAPVRMAARSVPVSVTGLVGQMRWEMARQAVSSAAAVIWNANCSIGLRGTRTRI